MGSHKNPASSYSDPSESLKILGGLVGSLRDYSVSLQLVQDYLRSFGILLGFLKTKVKKDHFWDLLRSCGILLEYFWDPFGVS